MRIVHRPAYHSAYVEATEFQQVGNTAILPIRTRIRGPAPPPEDPAQQDIVDEAIALFRANSLFRNFEIKGSADRTLIYLILFISDCLSRIGAAKAWSANEAGKQLQTYALDNFALPGDGGFPLNNLYSAPANRVDADLLRQYLLQARQECAARLVETVYSDGTGKPSKWWLSFQKRRFMGRSLSSQA